MISVCSMEYYNHSIRKHFESFCSDMALMHLLKYSICPSVEGQFKRTMNLHYYIHASVHMALQDLDFKCVNCA